MGAIAAIGLLALPAAAQTEIRKSPPDLPRGGEVKGIASPPAGPSRTVEADDRYPVATAAEISADGRATRFLLTCSHAIRYQIFTLADPYRVIIDIADVTFRLPKDAGLQGRGVIEAYRYGRFAPGKSRIVIDTSAPVRIEAARLDRRPQSAAARLIIDLVAIDRASFLAALPPPQARPQPRAALREEAPRARVGEKPMIVIDPGHGGVDPGAISPRGFYEKDIVLAAAWEFARELAATRHFRVVLTRSTDEFIRLRERVARARAWKADLFLSIHADALPHAQKRGLSVFTLSAQASDREAAALAVSENRADLVGGVNLSRQPRDVGKFLLDLARRETGALSTALAQKLVEELSREVELLERPQRSAAFAVLTALDVPSALIELGCLSNPAEERLLSMRAYHKKLARGLVLAVEAYFASHAAG